MSNKGKGGHKRAPTKVKLLARHMVGVIAVTPSFSDQSFWRFIANHKYTYPSLWNKRPTVSASRHQLIERAHNFINSREERAQVPP